MKISFIQSIFENVLCLRRTPWELFDNCFGTVPQYVLFCVIHFQKCIIILLCGKHSRKGIVLSSVTMHSRECITNHLLTGSPYSSYSHQKCNTFPLKVCASISLQYIFENVSSPFLSYQSNTFSGKNLVARNTFSDFSCYTFLEMYWKCIFM